MTDRVLTDEECQLAYENMLGAPGPMQLIRAVEARVLAKVALEGGRYVVVKDGAFLDTRSMATFVPESEARRREREAWDAGLQWHEDNSGVQCLPFGLGGSLAARDRRYPLPTPEPKEVVGPSGKEYTLRDGRVVTCNPKMAWWPPTQIPVEDVPTVAALMKEDAT